MYSNISYTWICFYPHGGQHVGLEISYEVKRMAYFFVKTVVILDFDFDHLDKYISMKEYIGFVCKRF